MLQLLVSSTYAISIKLKLASYAIKENEKLHRKSPIYFHVILLNK
jgi:hypothetical protein